MSWLYYFLRFAIHLRNKSEFSWKTQSCLGDPKLLHGGASACGVARQQTFVVHVHCPQQVASDRLDGFQAQPVDVGRRVVSSERRQVDARDGLQQPGGLQDTHTPEMAPQRFSWCCFVKHTRGGVMVAVWWVAVWWVAAWWVAAWWVAAWWVAAWWWRRGSRLPATASWGSSVLVPAELSSGRRVCSPSLWISTPGLTPMSRERKINTHICIYIQIYIHI